MPRYSPTRKVFSSVNKDIKELPFQEVYELYVDAYQSLKDDAESIAEQAYQLKVSALEQAYASNTPEEGSYEGNFSDQVSKGEASVPSYLIQKNTSAAIVTGFLEKYGIALHTEWAMPQIVSLLGSMPTYKNSNGKLSGLQFKRNNFTSDWLKGVFTMTMMNSKSSYLKLQYKAPSKQFGALVPLVLYAQRLTKGTPYSAWDFDEIDHVVHPDLADAMTLELPSFTIDELIANRKEGLTVKSGATVGTLKNPITTHSLTGITDPKFRQVPPLAQVMLTQIWMAHPSNRTKYMILAPDNWDNMPTPIIPEDVLHKQNDSTKPVVAGNSLW